MPVHALVLGGEPGLVVEVLSLGASVAAMTLTCGDGVRRSVVLGHASVEDRLASTAYIGSTVGRFANRIAGGRFELDGHEVVLETNDEGNTLHGGPDGFDRRLWDVESHDEHEAVLTLVSPDGDQGFPGDLHVRAAYAVDGDTLRLDLSATTDAPTVVGLTNHTYLNLDGQGGGTIDDHLLRVPAERYLPVDPTGLPLGVAPVEGAMDLRRPTRLGEAARSAHPQVVGASGLDHCYLVDGEGLRLHASLESPRTRTLVELWSDQRGLQVYTGNELDGSIRATTGGVHRQGDGVALEAQRLPDSPHHPDWPACVLRPGETYRSRIEWRFSRSDLGR